MRLKLMALGLMAGAQAAASVAQPAIQAGSEQPRIIVDGHGEVKTAPDVAVIAYSLRGEGATSDEAVRAMVASGQRIESTLRSIDANAEPRTSEIKISPAKGSACKDDRYDREDDQLSKGVCAIVGYVATQEITVRTGAVRHSGTMVGLAARGGAYNVRIDRFQLSDVQAPKGQAIAAALADAQAKAAAVAAGSHVVLGRLITISTTGRDQGQEIIVTGSRIPQRDVVSMAPVTVNLNAEKITTAADVTVTYAIGR
jgi:uncharacterized protein YggE